MGFLLISLNISGQSSDQWHHPLYLSNMDYWHSRIPVEIANPSLKDFAGEPVKLKTGKETEQLNIAGTEAGALRVVGSDGSQLLFKITSPDHKVITQGPVPDQSEVILPVTIKSAGTDIIYIYFNNPSAWPVGEVLEGDPSADRYNVQKKVPKYENPFHIKIKPTETIFLKNVTEGNKWPEDKNWSFRIPLKIFNFSEDDVNTLPVYIKMDQVYQRLHYKGCNTGIVRLGNGSEKNVSSFSNAILADNRIAPLTVKKVYSYFSPDNRSDRKDSTSHDWFNDKRNLISLPFADKNVKSFNNDWKLDIPVVPGKTYMFGAEIKGKGLSKEIFIMMNFIGSNGEQVKKRAESNPADTSLKWTIISGSFVAPEKAAKSRMSFNIAESETATVRGLVMMEVLEGFAGSSFMDQREAENLTGLKIWPVNSVVKVFQDDLPPAEIPQAAISAARNETEPLQIALRSSDPIRNVRIEVTAPVNTTGKKIDNVKSYLEGYVPIDYPSNYYERKVPYWYLKYPEEHFGSDGWAGYWPDPLMPMKKIDLEPGKAQPVWIEVFVPEGTPAGNYTGRIRISGNDSLLKEIPWTVHVWNFTLPAKNSFGALYDYRSPHKSTESGSDLFRTDITRDSLRQMYVSFMAQHRISSGEIYPIPRINYREGNVNIDFAEYDKAAGIYFDELKNPFAYLPVGTFYLFGWAFPPSEKFGEKPYPGDYPYGDADRSRLRPEYKKAYQLVLKTFWDHLEEKGWADRYILYLSDEPHEADNNNGKSDEIKIQMKALCDMIHEVDRKIPIYVSTWWYRPEWEGYINIWGLGFNGEGDYGHYVTAGDMKQITRSGGRIWYTTDGNFCTETPYLALERLLPWFGYKYGAEAYEFWGVNWLTYNPYEYGWHSYIFESQAPGEESWKRYPNGDGFIIYPGKPIGYDGLIGSIRLKQVREGAEDYEYLTMLGNLIEKAPPGNPGLKTSRDALQQALDLVSIPCAMGRYSTKILKSPDEILRVREQVAESIEKLTGK
jgi:Glycoside hydrolase 123, catalytic domain/Glycoside hydrolase 123 N-terminal domain